MCYYIVENMDGDTYVLAGPYETYDEALYWVTPTIAKLEEERQIGEVFVKAYPDGTDFHTHFCPTHVCTGDCHKEKETCSWKDRRDRGVGCGDAPIVQEVRDLESDPWKETTVVQTIMAYRSGWKGAWDAFVAAFSGDDRPQFPFEVTCSIWYKGAEPGVQIKIPEKTEWNKGSNWDWRGSGDDI